MKKALIVFSVIWVIFSLIFIAMNNGNKIPEAIINGVGATMLIFLYFLPSIIAETNKHRQYKAISTLNLLFGWTILGWIISLIWSLIKPSAVSS